MCRLCKTEHRLGESHVFGKVGFTPYQKKGRVVVHSAMEAASPRVEMVSAPVTETNKRDQSRKPGRPKQEHAMTPAERKQRQREKEKQA